MKLWAVVIAVCGVVLVVTIVMFIFALARMSA